MKTNKKLMCFTHWDLDGVVSYLVLRWAFPKYKIEYQPTTVQNFRQTYTKWLLDNDPEDYERVFIMDLGIFEDRELIDHKNVFIIDHHPGHGEYKKARTVIKEYPSACLLAYRVFKKLYNIKLSRAKKHLLLMANDQDSYKFELRNTNNLNTIFWDSSNKFETFIKSFINGFNGFTLKQENIIKLHSLNLKKIKDSMEVYGGKVEVQGKKYYVCSTMVNQYINEIADSLFTDYNADIALVINGNTHHVSYRRKPNSEVDLAKMAKDLADGYGHEFSSGSEITDDFLDFTKKLNKI